MKKHITVDDSNKRLLTLKEASNYLNIGKNNTRSLMDDIGATIHICGRVLFDKPVIDKYLDEILHL